MPSLVVVDLSNDGYFLPPGAVETERHLLDFLDGVLDGSVQVSLTKLTQSTMEKIRQQFPHF